MSDKNLKPHTPLPWILGRRVGAPPWDFAVCAEKGPLEIAQLFNDGTEDNEGGEANGKYIVEACNAYPRLVAEIDRLTPKSEVGRPKRPNPLDQRFMDNGGYTGALESWSNALEAHADSLQAQLLEMTRQRDAADLAEATENKLRHEAEALRDSQAAEIAKLKKEVDDELHKRFEGNRLASIQQQEEAISYQRQIDGLKQKLANLSKSTLAAKEREAVKEIFDRILDLEIIMRGWSSEKQGLVYKHLAKMKEQIQALRTQSTQDASGEKGKHA